MIQLPQKMITAVLTCIFLVSHFLTTQIPLEAKEQEVVANYRTERRNDGRFRADGSDETFDYCIEGDYAGCYYNPQVGDRVNVGYTQGWRLTFWNVGEMGGEAKKIAKLEKITEFFTAGDIITEVLPPENAESFNSGITYSKINTTPADPADILDPYINLKYIFTLGFTGGPKGVFYEMDGIIQHPNGKSIRGDVMQGEDGGYYVQMSGAFTANLAIDQPGVFDGFVDTPADRKVIFESRYAQGFSDYGGEVYVETSDGDAEMADEFDVSKQRLIPSGSTIRTGLDGYAVIVLDSSGSRLVIGPNSWVKIQKPEVGWLDGANGRALMKLKGNLEKMIKDGTMNVELTQAVAGRKGTTFVILEEEGVSTVKVLEGEIALSSKATGESKDVLAGQMLSATSSGLGDVSPFDMQAELADWEQVVPKTVMDEIRADMAESPVESVSEEPLPANEAIAVEETSQADQPAFNPLYMFGLLGLLVLVLIVGIVLIARRKKAPTA